MFTEKKKKKSNKHHPNLIKNSQNPYITRKKKKLDMKSTRKTKSKDATSLHSARKSSPSDLTYSSIVQSFTASTVHGVSL